MLNAHWARWEAILSFMEFIHGHVGLSSNSGVLGNGCPIHYISTFRYYRSTFKRRVLLIELLV